MDFLIVVFMWVSLSFVAAWLAHVKGRDPGTMFLLSFFLSPLVGFIAAMSIDTHEQFHRYQARHGRDTQYRLCPECDELIRRQATRCRYCTSEVDPSSPRETVAERRAA